MGMTSARPYLIRAIHAWVLDNGLTPHVVVDVDQEGVEVPPGRAQDGQIVLNIHPDAVRDLDLGDQWISFNARFSGRPFHVLVPASAVLAVYARENGQGMAFPSEDASDGESSPEPDDRPPSGPRLRVVK